MLISGDFRDDRLATVGIFDKSARQYVCQRTEHRSRKEYKKFSGMAAQPVDLILPKKNKQSVQPSDYIDAYPGTE